VATSQPAGRRIPFRLWLVSGDALGERDENIMSQFGEESKIMCSL
jgi:hypothetical protein